MTTFFLDLWHDLREKRLWPVAAGLVLAILVVPIALSKSSSQPSTPAAPPVAQKAAHLPAVSLDQNSVASSHLDVFKERNPFKDLSDKVAAPGTTGTAPTSGAVPLGSAVASNVNAANSANSGSGGGGSSSSSSGSSGGGSSSSSSSPSNGGSGGGSPASSGSNSKPARPSAYGWVYTADVRFGKVGHVHTYNGVQQLALLPPDSKSSVLSFYGVKGGAKAAIFFNYKGMSAAGEGKCSDSCGFVSLKVGQEETFTAGSNTAYTLKLLALHTRPISKKQAMGDTTPDTNVKAASKKKDKTLLSLPRIVFKL